MINTLKRATKLAPLLAVAAIFATAAFAQAPSQAQRDAIKAQCRSRLHGALLKRAARRRGFAAMPAEEHVEPLIELPERGARRRSAGCTCSDDRQAGRSRAGQICSARGCNDGSAQIRRAKGRGQPNQPTSAQISAIRNACRSDYPKVCAGVPTGGAPALQCLEKNKVKLSAACGNAVAAASGGGAAAPATAAAPAAAGAAPAAAAPTVIVLRPMRPREELFVLRSACGADVRSICGGVAPGGGRILQCLATNAAQLSPACKDVLSQFAAQ